ncbi:MAG TPA: molybdopterin-dependent oxidoreductase [Dehalococcoidia bacterium]
MAKLTLNDTELEVPEGAQLVEVIKNSGEFISNLCYVDGLPPYAGCRTCIVEIDGLRGFQLACTTKVTGDKMVVRTRTPELHSTRQAVLSLILSYHSDRCLTCHRIVKCKPGDTCLRDDSITHRCLTCSKNYRCELQTTCEMLEMAGYEPWDGDERTYYNLPQPPADQANPFLEFDPQMCIICTRCVRACDEIRHTGAITLAGRGFSTRIEFGQGGAVADSNCDFCGACIDVCPTATLMEHPNKWSATQTERWTPSTCTQCSVGCSIHLGTQRGRGVIVKPDTHANPVSRDQLCVRGRFHYDAVKPSVRLGRPLIKRNGGQDESGWREAMDFTTARLVQVREAHGPDAIGFLASPLATNEENYLLGKIARAIVGTNNIDSSAGPVSRAVAAALRATFGSEVLPTDGARVADSKTLLIVAQDIESSHNVYSLRAKDAVVRGKARLINVSALWGEINDFAEAWIQPKPGDEAAVVIALAEAVDGKNAAASRDLLSPEAQAAFDKAVAILQAAKTEAGQPFTAIAGLSNFGATATGAIVGSLANIAVSLAGADAAKALLVLPQEANVWGMRDVGGSPELLPGHRAAGDDAARQEMRRLWGAEIPSNVGLTIDRMAGLKALVVLNDNPLMLAPDRAASEQLFSALDFLAVIDSVPTDTANLAHALLPDAGYWAKEGTTTSADRRVLRLNQAHQPRGEAQQGWRILSELGVHLAGALKSGEIHIHYTSAAEIMDEIAEVVPLYRNAGYREIDSGQQQYIDGLGPRSAVHVTVHTAVASNSHGGAFTLSTSRGLYTSYEAAATHSKEADRLHREDSLKMNPADAAALGLASGDVVTVHNARSSVAAPVEITAAVQPKMLWIASFYDAGAPAALFAADSPVASVEVSRA